MESARSTRPSVKSSVVGTLIVVDIETVVVAAAAAVIQNGVVAVVEDIQVDIAAVAVVGATAAADIDVMDVVV